MRKALIRGTGPQPAGRATTWVRSYVPTGQAPATCSLGIRGHALVLAGGPQAVTEYGLLRAAGTRCHPWQSEWQVDVCWWYVDGGGYMDTVRRLPVQLITISREYGAGGSELGM